MRVELASAVRCPGCGKTVVGKVTVRPLYTLMRCVNRRPVPDCCGQFLLLIPLPDGLVCMQELPEDVGKRVIRDPHRSLRDWLAEIGVMRETTLVRSA